MEEDPLRRLRKVRCGTWKLERSKELLHLDQVAQEELTLPATLAWDMFLERVHPEDRAELLERVVSSSVERIWAPFRFINTHAETLRVESVGTYGEEICEGILISLKDLSSISGPLSESFSVFAEALGVTQSSDDVARSVSLLGEEVLGASFTGISIPDPKTGALSYLQAKALPVGVTSGWGSYPPDSITPVAEVMRTGRGQYHPSRESFLEAYPHMRDLVSELGLNSWAGLPMKVSAKVSGVLVLHWKEAREMSAYERRVLATLAAQVGQALERAFLYERQEDAMSMLQEVVLPAVLPEGGGLELAARYLPSDSGVKVGGDWYDVFYAPNGELVLALGDVAGHGIKAAASMGQIRNALRAYVSLGMLPNEVLGALNNLTYSEDNTYASVICGFFNKDSGVFKWASAGHFPPILESLGETQALNVEADPLLGASWNYSYTLQNTWVPRKATLAFYTDGLVEERGKSLQEGMSRVEKALQAGAKTAIEVRCHQVLEAALEGRERADDLCLLLARRNDESEQVESMHFAQTLKTPAAAREFARHILNKWDIKDLEEVACLLISEAATNAVVHARSSVKITMRLDEDVLTVSVQDKSSQKPVLKKVNTVALNGRGVSLIDMLSSSWGVDHTTHGKNVWFTLKKK